MRELSATSTSGKNRKTRWPRPGQREYWNFKAQNGIEDTHFNIAGPGQDMGFPCYFKEDSLRSSQQ